MGATQHFSRGAIGLIGVGAGAFGGVSAAWSVVLLASAARDSRSAPRRHDPPAGDDHVVVLVPAHDEEAVLGATLRGLLAVAGARHRVVVLADHCTDGTVAVARAQGAEVLEREHADERGKGAALAWALPRVLAEDPAAVGVLVVDADCTCDDALPDVVAAELTGGAAVVQGAYRVANAGASRSVALRTAAWLLHAHLRPMGREGLGLSAGLYGSGMGFSRDALRAVPWSATSATEDTEQHLVALGGGQRVRFLPRVGVSAPLPTAAAAARNQERRWESGRAWFIRNRVPGLLAQGVRRRDGRLLAAAAELVLPALSVQVAAAGVATAAGVLVGDRRLRALGAVSLAGQATYVLAGLRVAGAPATVFRALPGAAVSVPRKLALYARLLAADEQPSWSGRARQAPVADDPPVPQGASSA